MRTDSHSTLLRQKRELREALRQARLRIKELLGQYGSDEFYLAALARIDATLNATVGQGEAAK